GDLARTMTGQKNQLEAVLDLVDAILNGNAGHLSPFSLVELSESLPVHIANGAEKQASCSKPATSRARPAHIACYWPFFSSHDRRNAISSSCAAMISSLSLTSSASPSPLSR